MDSLRGIKMIKRVLEKELKYTATLFPVVAVLGPRQSGKTTLVKYCFKKYNYISLEDIDNRKFAIKDPRLFLEKYKNKQGLILDEIQNAPDLLSYIQTLVDENKEHGQFILTGSQNFLLNESISQTLAGRVGILTLLPLSINEFKKAKLLPERMEKILFTGCYPRIFDRKVPPRKWYPSYIRTYIERDVRTIKNVSDVTLFQQFMMLCAGRIGQILNLTSLCNDCGITFKTAQSWLSLLEQSYIIFLLRPHHKNFSKRLIKSPKLYFYDTGLASYILGVKNEKELMSHHMRGHLFESFVISEIIKDFYNVDETPRIYFWRDNAGNEVDCIIDRGTDLIPVEIKSGKTINSSFFDGLNYWNALSKQDKSKSFVVYGGDENQKRTNGKVLGWKSISNIIK